MYKINADDCLHCTLCASDCPENAITEVNGCYTIIEDKCANCGTCAENCPAGAIVED